MARTLLAPCSYCVRDTTHQIIHTVMSGGAHRYETIRCRGCNGISFKDTYEFSDKRIEPIIQYYPAPISRQRPVWSHLMSGLYSEEAKRFEDLLDETYKATQNGLPRLALMGIRAVLEQVMILKVGDKQSFFKNLSAFADSGYISVKQHDVLQIILDVGHAVVHRTFEPTKNDLDTALDVLEGVLAAIYVHEVNVEFLSTKIPGRRSEQRS